MRAAIVRVVVMSIIAFSAGSSTTIALLALRALARGDRPGPDLALQRRAPRQRLLDRLEVGEARDRPRAARRGSCGRGPAAPAGRRPAAGRGAARRCRWRWLPRRPGRGGRRSGTAAPEKVNATSRPSSPKTAPSTTPAPALAPSGSCSIRRTAQAPAELVKQPACRGTSPRRRPGRRGRESRASVDHPALTAYAGSPTPDRSLAAARP